MPRASLTTPTTLAHRQDPAVCAAPSYLGHVVVIINRDHPAGPV